MRHIAIAACLTVLGIVAAGCPGSHRGDGQPIVWDGGYSVNPPGFVTFDLILPADIIVGPDYEGADGEEPLLPCGSDEDCPWGFCDPKYNVCVECYENFHCQEGQLCIDNECVDRPPCGPDTPCPDGMICFEKLGVCVECLSDADCPEGKTCEKYMCKESNPSCLRQEDCPDGMYCNVDVGTCVWCLGDEHCDENEWCDLEEGECREDLCVPGTKVCVSGGVIECKENGSGYGDVIPCPEGTVCENGECKLVEICIPGESYCVSEVSYYECAETGDEWITVECPAGTTCEEEDGFARCTGECVPDCSMFKPNTCGPDGNGCGVLCNECEPGWFCPDDVRTAVPGTVAPCEKICSCEGKECGDDGCGGWCGDCNPSYICQAGQCVYAGYSCEKGYDCVLSCSTMPNDLCVDACITATKPNEQWILMNLVECIKAYCEGSVIPDCAQEAADTVCADWLNKCICVPYCVGKECGDDGCGGVCGVCPDGYDCDNGKCVCIPNCANKECGDDGCGGLCGVCPPNFVCTEYGKCYCTPNCEGKECGDDGCGGWCGKCDPNETCVDGQCIVTCLPSCESKECGDDGCGGVCGICPPNETCVDGDCIVPPTCQDMLECAKECFPLGPPCFDMCTKGADPIQYGEFKALWGCLEEVCGESKDPECVKKALTDACYQLYLACVSCLPSCEGKECGPDGCGGSCGKCPDNFDCISGKCVPVCIPNCEGRECGDNGCGGLCGVCKAGYQCVNGKCELICVPQCEGKECGPDGCGGSCGFCTPGTTCIDGLCLPIPLCGDGFCDKEAGETPYSCPQDCGNPTNGCEPSPFPGCGGCKCEECVCSQDPYCCEVQWDQLCVQECIDCGGCCIPNCQGKECGPDGCGGKCGVCPEGMECNPEGKCQAVCKPDCDGKECGPDDCGGVCGICPYPQVCLNYKCFVGKSCAELLACSVKCAQETGGQCLYDCMEQGTPEAQSEFFALAECLVAECGFNLTLDCMLAAMEDACQDEYYACIDCTPNCKNKQCGPDGCGGSCGTCPPDFYCDNYKCKAICKPDCTGKECGPNGCGGSCGTCPPDEECVDGKCVPVCKPNCVGKECGDDGCGGLCGLCPPGFICQDFKCVQAGPKCGDGKCNFMSGETCITCPEDCGPCGDGCIPTPYPGCGGCICEECVCEMDPYCCTDEWDELCVQECYECGGCGCVPNCEGKECGPDGCGGVCGYCPPNAWCDPSGKCVFGCQPQCEGKECGPDGCGGSCGTCPPGTQCSPEGICVCVPDCWNKECGDDGCGGSCGTCGPFQICTPSGKCKFITPLCGDGKCMTIIGEDCDVCPQDCGPCCPNGICEPKYLENCKSCPEDCGPCCPNGVCDEDLGETCESCPEDCGPCSAKCGDGKCDPTETCATCPQDCGACQESCCVAHDTPGCSNFYVQNCVCASDPFCCTDHWDDLCAEEADHCGSCNGDCCAANPTPGCDDEQVEACVCHFDEYCCNVKWDGKCASEVEWLGCGKCQEQPGCGDGVCDFLSGETCETCPIDCGPCCIPNCFGKECGDDGCGGSCGTCPPNETCNEFGQCVPSQGLSCSQILACVQECGYTMECVMDCSSQGSPSGQKKFFDLITCALKSCFPPTPECIAQSFVTKCKKEFQACIAD